LLGVFNHLLLINAELRLQCSLKATAFLRNNVHGGAALYARKILNRFFSRFSGLLLHRMEAAARAAQDLCVVAGNHVCKGTGLGYKPLRLTGDRVHIDHKIKRPL